MSAGPAPHASSGVHEHAEGDVAQAVEAIRKAQRRRRLRTGFLAAVFGIALATLAVELFLRFSGARDKALAGNVTLTNRRWIALTQAGIFEELDDPVRRYAGRPFAEAAIDGFRFRITSHRSRGEDLPSSASGPPRVTGEKVLLCVGDSYAFGLWCDEDETLVGQLVQRANERELERGTGVLWHAANLGVPGYNSVQQLRAFEKDGLALEPDVVVLYFNTNDIEQTGFFFDAELGVLRRDFLPLPVRLRRTLWRWSHLYGWIASAHARAVETPDSFLDPRAPHAHTRPANQTATKAAIARIAELCRERGIGLFLVHQPLMTFMGDTRRSDWNMLPLVRWAEEMRAELGIPGLNLLGWMRGYADGVDRMEGLAPGADQPPPDFILDTYFADERFQAALRFAQERARAEGQRWESLGFAEQARHLSAWREALPALPDFHLSGAGYAHVARLVYPRMQAEGFLP